MKRRWHSLDVRGMSASRLFILHARHWPEFRTLRSDPRFAAILREMDSPEENEERPS